MNRYLSIVAFFVGLILGLFIGNYRITLLKNALLKQEQQVVTQQLTDVKNETQLADSLVSEFLTEQNSDAAEREKLEADIYETESTATNHTGLDARELCLYRQALGYNCTTDSTGGAANTATQTNATQER